MFLLVASVLALYATTAAAGVSLTPPPDTVIPTSSVLGSTTTNGSLSVTPTSSAQFPSLSGFSDCVTNCLQLAVAATNCTSVTDVNCYCKTSRFAKSLVNCTEVFCSQEVDTAESLAQQFCFIGNASTSLSFPSATSIPSSSTRTIPSSSSTMSLSSLASSTTTDSSGTSSGSATPTTVGNTVGTPNAAATGLLVGSTSVVSSQFLGLGLALLGVFIGATLVE